MKQEFSSFVQENEDRIHFHIHRLGISPDLYDDFYSEGLYALWKAYESYQPDQGNLGTFLNYRIRYRLIDLLRKKMRQQENMDALLENKKAEIDDGNKHRTLHTPLVNPQGIPLDTEEFWNEVRKHLTAKQWNWVKYFIIDELSIKEIQEKEGVSNAAVKGWGSEVRRKLSTESIRQKLMNLL